MTSNDQTPEPTRNPPGIIFDTVLLLAGTYAVARTGGKIVKHLGQSATAAMSFGTGMLTLFFLAIGTAMVALSVLALAANIRKVPRDYYGRAIPAAKRDEGE